jgi:hypothetical protein
LHHPRLAKSKPKKEMQGSFLRIEKSGRQVVSEKILGGSLG